MLKVGFNARILSSPTLRGWNRYTVSLIKALCQYDVKIFLYSDQPLSQTHLNEFISSKIELRISHKPNQKYLFWEQIELAKMCRQDALDVFHSPFHFGVPFFLNTYKVLTLHDAIDVAFPSLQTHSISRFNLNRLKYKFYFWLSKKGANHIITVSDFSRQDLIKHQHLESKKITVIYEAADPKFSEPIQETKTEEVRNKFNLIRPYFFYVGGFEERKNIPFLLSSFSKAKLEGIDLVLAGGGEKQISELMQLATLLGTQEHVKFLGSIPEADLPVLYREALCFVYPSLYEGFGLQLCEAMAVGCPILASNRTCFPEILGAGGEYFFADQEESLIEVLKKILTETDFLREMKERAIRRSNDFSWEKTAKKTIEVYQKQRD
jgi:glycosyltransferase involved in cell wall biosynthesis